MDDLQSIDTTEHLPKVKYRVAKETETLNLHGDASVPCFEALLLRCTSPMAPTQTWLDLNQIPLLQRLRSPTQPLLFFFSRYLIFPPPYFQATLLPTESQLLNPPGSYTRNPRRRIPMRRTMASKAPFAKLNSISNPHPYNNNNNNNIVTIIAIVVIHSSNAIPQTINRRSTPSLTRAGSRMPPKQSLTKLT